MLLVKPRFKINYFNASEMLCAIEMAGRTCYKSFDQITSESAVRFVKKLIERGHESVIEHEKISVRILCDRGVMAELTRHRLASFSVESTRYCDYQNHVAFVIPPWCNIEPGEFGTEPQDEPDACLAQVTDDPSTYTWLMTMAGAERAYKSLRQAGWTPEEARTVLPNSLKTEMVMSANLREWRHFFKLRTAKAAHPQMREITIPMLQEFKLKLPEVFGDL